MMYYNNRMKKILSIFILLLFIVGCDSKQCLNPGVGASEYYRLDLKNLDKDSSLGNLRIITKGHYQLKETKEKYHLDEDYIVNEKGLDKLNISGSRQFSTPQFYELSNELKQVAGDKKIYIIDLRQENHGMINGYPVSYYKEHNWANKGLSEKEIDNNQKKMFSNLLHNKMTIYLKGDDETASDENIELDVEEYISEKELVESEGFEYINIPCVDHIWPSAENIDRFIEFVKTIDTNNTWLHFHCVAGEGRTGTFMCLYDMMKNPDIPMKDITYRQAKLGSNYPLYIQTEDDWKKPLYQEKADNFVLLYRYVQENNKNNYQVLWSEWLNNNKNNIDILRVSMFPSLNNGDYAKKILIEMWNQVEPNIKLEFVETSFHETDYPNDIDVQIRAMENLPYRISQNHYHRMYTDEIDNYNDLVKFAKNNIAINGEIYGIPWLLCDNFFFYYKDDEDMKNVNNIYELADLLSNNKNIPKEVSSCGDKIFYCKGSLDYYALDSLIDEKGLYSPFSYKEYINESDDVNSNIKQIVNNGIYSSSNIDNIEEFSAGKGRGIFCYSEKLYLSNLDLDKISVKTLSFSKDEDIPLLYMDEVCISEHVKDELKYAKCLKLANLLTSKEYLNKLIFMDDKPQYYLPVLESVFEECNKYPIYSDLYNIINNQNAKLALCDKENINEIQINIE